MTRKITQEEDDVLPIEQLTPSRRRNRLLREANFSCSQCGFSRKRDDGICILEIDHVDGNHQNNVRENLRVLCPNCHAFTPTFRNYGRKGHLKTSTRIRPANKGFEKVRERLQQEKNEYENHFRQLVTETFQSGEIDYAKFGWVNKLATKIGNDISAQVVGRQIRRLMPDFYFKHCFFRRNHRKFL